jgi:hypothetical protein
MKLSTVIIVLSLGLIAYAVFFAGKSAPPGASSSLSLLSSLAESFKSGPSTLFGKHATWEISELHIARGTVVERLPGALVVDCAAPSIPHPPSYYGNVHASIDQPLPLGAAANREELQLYGTLMAVERGNARPSPIDPGVWNASKYIQGTALLTGYPPALMDTGKKFKIVVIPNGASTYRGRSIPAYSATFALAGGTPAPSNDWMWKNHGAPL